MPFDEIGESQIAALVENGVPEDRTLEYKRELNLHQHDDKVEFLKDVSAFANTAGGVIIYGISEGEGEDKGIPTGSPGVSLNPTQTHERVDNLLQTGIDERIPGVAHRAIERAAGGHYYIVRVPPSPLAPHMIAFKTSGPRFYSRGTASCQPMNTRQIKETAVRLVAAEDRAVQLVEQRTKVLRALIRNRRGTKPSIEYAQAVLHVLPLLAQSDLVDFADSQVITRLYNLGCPGGFKHRGRYSLEGYYNECPEAGPSDRHILVLRDGGLEFQWSDVLRVGEVWGGSSGPIFQAYPFEELTIQCLEVAQSLSEAQILGLPALVSLRLLDVGPSTLQMHKTVSGPLSQQMNYTDVFLPPWVLMNWGPVSEDRQVRHMFDVLWQAFGHSRSLHYDRNGNRPDLGAI